MSRRSWLFALASSLPAQTPGPRGRVLEPDWAKYLDPATEFEVVRLTMPAYETVLPPLPSRAVTRSSNEVLVASSRTGSMQLHRVDLANGRWRLITEAAALNPESATLTSDDRSAIYVDENRLLMVPISGGRETRLYAAQGEARLHGPLAPTGDGLSLFFMESGDGVSRLKHCRLPRGPVETVAETAGNIQMCSPNPRRATVAWVNGDGELWLAAFDGAFKRRLETPPGQVLQCLWPPDGKELLYLLDPGVYGQPVEIRSQELDNRSDKLVAKTSQFSQFAPNGNASVFVGASRSKASPAMLLLLRVTRRELTLCEHQAADARRTAPRFTTDSQRVLFESDRHGKTAIYMVKVDRLVEKTDS